MLDGAAGLVPFFIALLIVNPVLFEVVLATVATGEDQ